MKVGTIKEIWRYPVKGMAGETLTKSQLGQNGIQGDRSWAVQDIKRREIQSCKFRPQLLQCSSKVADDESVIIDFPDGQSLSSTEPEVDKLISELVGHASCLQALRPATDSEFYQRFKEDDHTWLKELKATFAREPGEPLPDLDNLPPEMQKYVSIVGTFFLVSPFHILTTASLEYMKTVSPDADWSIPRFRPNIVVETLPELSGLVEQEWLGKTLTIGNSKVRCSDTAPRCGAVVRPQKTLKEDKQTLRSIVKNAEQNLGIYGDIVSDGEIRIGDEVYLA